MSEQKEPKQKFIKFAPLITAPEPVNPSSIACKVEDYNALVQIGFYVLHQSQSLVTFTRNFTLTNGQICNTNLRFEKDSWQCTVALQFDKRDQAYETFYSAKYKELKDLMNRLNLTFNSIHEFFKELSESVIDQLPR